MKNNSLLKITLGIAAFSLLFACNNTRVDSLSEPSSSISSSESSESSSSESSSSEESSSEVSSSSTLPIVSQPDDAILIQSITYKSASYKVALTKSATIKPGVLPVEATYRTLFYESSDKSIFTVNSQGYVVGVGIGEATLTAYALDGSGITGSTQIIVYGTEIDSISLNYTTKSCGVGETFKLIPSFAPASATFKECIWSSSDNSVATVSEEGIVTCVKDGNATIRIESKTNPKAFSECKLTVTYVELRNFYIAERNVYLHVGEDHTLTPKFSPENASYRSITYTSSNSSVATVNGNGLITAKAEGKATITAKSNTKNITDTITVEVSPTGKLLKTNLNYTYLDYGRNNVYSLSYCPSIGDVSILVVPVWFTDSKSYINTSSRETVRNDINYGFFGSNNQTGWRSVKTYYADESHNRLNLDGFTTEWFECGESVSEFKANQSKTVSLVNASLEWAKGKYPDKDFTKFDSDADGSIDAIILVYAAPDYNSLRDYNSSNLWAYCNWTQKNGTVDNPQASGFMWTSYDFMYGWQTAYSKVGSYYGYGDTSKCSVDTHTFIHEFGHLFGLSDYYDYSSQYSPCGGFSMQDHNIGGHDPYSSIALGWADPYIPTLDEEITLNPFESSGDVILLTNNFNQHKSPFDEYLLLEFYTPTGVNEFDADGSNTSRIQMSGYGIRIWHVDARLIVGSYSSIMSSKTLTTNPFDDGGVIYHAMSNTYYKDGDSDTNQRISWLGKDYADYNLLSFIRNNLGVNYHPKDAMSNTDLFKTNDEFSMERFGVQFKNKGLLNTGDELEWDIEFKDINKTTAKIGLTRK